MAGGAPPAERADAVRNRRKILAAAAEVAEREGWAAMTIEDVAKAAGVGVGTIYRRFADRAGLLGALVNDREVELQRAFIAGPPPLGPGAPPVHHTHLAMLVREARPGADAEFVASALLSAVNPRTLEAHRRDTGAPLAQIKAGIDDLLHGFPPG